MHDRYKEAILAHVGIQSARFGSWLQMLDDDVVDYYPPWYLLDLVIQSHLPNHTMEGAAFWCQLLELRDDRFMSAFLEEETNLPSPLTALNILKLHFKGLFLTLLPLIPPQSPQNTIPDSSEHGGSSTFTPTTHAPLYHSKAIPCSYGVGGPGLTEQVALRALGLTLQSGHNLWYHGTSLLNANAILENGIEPKNQSTQDFGFGDAFYMSSSLSGAIAWSLCKFKSPGDPPALLVFSFPDLTQPAEIPILQDNLKEAEVEVEGEKVNVALRPCKHWEITGEDWKLLTWLSHNKNSQAPVWLKEKYAHISKPIYKANQLASKADHQDFVYGESRVFNLMEWAGEPIVIDPCFPQLAAKYSAAYYCSISIIGVIVLQGKSPKSINKS